MNMVEKWVITLGFNKENPKTSLVALTMWSTYQGYTTKG
jgi:hypothetical protein